MQQVTPSLKYSFKQQAHAAATALRLQIPHVYARTLANRRKVLRLGSTYGGWVVPTGIIDRTSVCYCVGCGEDISFDLELIRRFSCHVFAFDPTPRSIAYVSALARDIPEYHFEDIAIWDRDGHERFYEPRDTTHVSHSLTNLQNTDRYIDVRVKRLQSVLAEKGHGRRLTLLKLDIEGAELAVLESIVEDRIEIDILLVEFDSLLHRQHIPRAREAVRALRDGGYVPFWFEGRNVTFVHKTQPRWHPEL